MSQPLRREDLPDTLVKAWRERLDSYSPLELRGLAARPMKLVPVPEGRYPPGIEKRMRNLAQYGGRSVKGQLRSLANLTRQRTRAMPNGATT